MEKRVYLRALEPEDYNVSVQWRNDEEIWSMLGGPKYYVSSAYEKKWVEDAIFNSKNIKLAVCLLENHQYIGNLYMTDFDDINRSCHSHILIGNKSYWGHGYAREALIDGLKYVFNERNINRVQALVLESNTQSLKMHQKCGYSIEGILRNSIFKNGQYQNQYILSILRSEMK